MKQIEKDVINLLRIDPRMTLTSMSRQTGKPITKLYETIQALKPRMKWTLEIKESD